jgi:hypothetical protein
MIRIILGIIFIYIGFKLYKLIKALYNSTKSAPNDERFKKNPREKINIKKEDIIDADFEEIEPDKTESKKSKE